MSEREKLLRLTDALVEDILETPADEILREFEEQLGGAEPHIVKMRELIRDAVNEATAERDAAKVERERILALLDNEIKEWYSHENVSLGLLKYRDGCIDALKYLRRLIDKDGLGAA